MTNPASANEPKATVLLMSSSQQVETALAEILQSHFHWLAVSPEAEAAEQIKRFSSPDVILLDCHCSGQNSLALLKQLNSDETTKAVPVILVTESEPTEQMMQGLALGVVDYLSKPFCAPLVLSRVHTQIALQQAHARLLQQSAQHQAELARKVEECQAIQDISIFTLARLAEARDEGTGIHLRRTQGYVRILAEGLSEHPRYTEALTKENIEILCKSALLHDIGKIGIPDHILLKTAELTPEERQIVQTHTKLGSDAMELAKRDSGKPVRFLEMAQQIAYYHHEKWDGTGYPVGLAGEAIPIPARLMALADVFDALITSRQYKSGWDLEKAKELIVQESGLHFDPDVVTAFLNSFEDFTRVARTHGEQDAMRHAEIIYDSSKPCQP